MAKNADYAESVDIKMKVNSLLRRHRFNEALDALLSEPEVDRKALARVYLEWGNALLQKGDAIAALQKYIGTIGTIASLQIIKKFSSARHSELLLQYLQAVVSGGYASDMDKELLIVLEKRKQIQDSFPDKAARKEPPPAVEQAIASKQPETSDILHTLKALLQERENTATTARLVDELQQYTARAANKDFNQLLFIGYLSLWRRKLLSEAQLEHGLTQLSPTIAPEDALVGYKMFWYLPGIRQVHDSLKADKFKFDAVLEAEQAEEAEKQTVAGNLVEAVEHYAAKFECKQPTSAEQLRQHVDQLSEQLAKLKALHESLQRQPIQYRNSLCGFCKEPLKLPAVFFLCQHSFHRECAKANSFYGKCSECESTKLAHDDTTNAPNAAVLLQDVGNKIIRELALTLANGGLQCATHKSVSLKQRALAQSTQTASKKAQITMAPPNDYDLNSNPFESNPFEK